MPIRWAELFNMFEAGDKETMMKNVITLVILLAVVAAIVLGIHYAGSQVDNKSKYTHPITRDGARW